MLKNGIGDSFVEISENCLFAAGGNRVCFIHPGDPSKVLKINRNDWSPEIKKASAGFPKNLRPLDAFDENVEESMVLDRLAAKFPDECGELFPRSYGMVETNYGRALISDAFRDGDGQISRTVESHLMTGFGDAVFHAAVDRFSTEWVRAGIPSRQLLLHNILVQKVDEKKRLVVCDGLGWPTWLAVFQLSSRARRQKAAKRVGEFRERIRNFQNNLDLHGAEHNKWAVLRTSRPSAEEVRKMIRRRRNS